MSPNRVVAVLTPLLFAPLAGVIAAWLAEHFPGIQVDQSSVEKIFIAGALTALAPATQWLHGWQKHEARQAELERDVALASVAIPATATSGSPAHVALHEEEALGEEETIELDESDDLEELGDPEELGDADDLDDLDELDDLEELSETGDLDEVDDFDDLDAELLGEEEPATAGS